MRAGGSATTVALPAARGLVSGAGASSTASAQALAASAPLLTLLDDSDTVRIQLAGMAPSPAVRIPQPIEGSKSGDHSSSSSSSSVYFEVNAPHRGMCFVQLRRDTWQPSAAWCHPVGHGRGCVILTLRCDVVTVDSTCWPLRMA